MDINAQLLIGRHHRDERGTLSYFNDFSLEKIKRHYLIFHPDTEVIRGWQGHKVECKWFQVVTGAFKIVTVQPDQWLNPSTCLIANVYQLTEDINQIFYLPGGNVSGIQATIPDSKMIVFSNMTVEESKNDDFRFDKNLWYKW